jgi:hypothetical protein
MTAVRASSVSDPITFDLHVRGEIPSVLNGFLVVAASRRHKNRTLFSRWQDSQADLIRLELFSGKPGRVRAQILPVDPSGMNLGGGFNGGSFDHRSYGKSPLYGYATQPNHGVNIANDTIWATNLLFGAPLEVSLDTFTPRRVLRYVQPYADAPRVSTTAHFAWSFDHRFAYFHQSLLKRESNGANVVADELRLIELDLHTGAEHTWELLPPPDEDSLESANFHSAFYYEEEGKKHVGLLKTGAVIEHLAPHIVPRDHVVKQMQPSSIWSVAIDYNRNSLKAKSLPGIRQLDGLALSHLDVDNSGGNGFTLYANYKQADVAEETHGKNIYNESPENVTEHYSGMIVEAINHGLVIRYQRRQGRFKIKTFSRAYDYGMTSLGHSWLPINIKLGSSKRHLFCTFSGFRPRLLSSHIAKAYKNRAVDPASIRYVPPLLMRFNADTLEPDYDKRRSYLSYAEPIAMTLAGEGAAEFLCTFSPEAGLRIYPADDFNYMVGHATSAQLMNWKDSYFRPDPAHMEFVYR